MATNSSYEKDLEVVVDESLNYNRHCTKAVLSANKIIGIINRTYSCKSKLSAPVLQTPSAFFTVGIQLVIKFDCNRSENCLEQLCSLGACLCLPHGTSCMTCRHPKALTSTRIFKKCVKTNS